MEPTGELERRLQSVTETAQALAVANRRFERVLRAARMAVWEWNLATGEFYLSPYLFETPDHGPATLVRGLRILHRVHVQERGRLLGHVRERLAHREPFEFECRLRRNGLRDDPRDGNYRWFRINGHGEWPDGAAQPLRIAGSVLDIDERVRHAASPPERVAYRERLTDVSDRTTFSEAPRAALAQADQAVHVRQRLEHELQEALEREEFVLDYQPEVDVATREVVGAEALLRWHHPVRGRLLPCEIIPVAEDTGLIIPIGAWVIRQVCRDLARWATAREPLRIAINLSPVQFIHGDVVGTLRAAMAEYGTPAGCIEVEITESLLLRDMDRTRGLLAELHELGVNVSLDDFGSGYSSLAYLLELPIDTVKIDRSFIGRLDQDDGSRIITRAIVNLAHSLHLHVLGEGVETTGQLHWLREFGCDFAQGFLFSRPLSARDFETWALEYPRGSPRRAPRPELAAHRKA